MSGQMTKLEPRISIITLLVRDMHRSFEFYAKGLGFPTSRTPDSGWVGFRLNGICFCIYPYKQFTEEKLGRTLDEDRALDQRLIPPMTLAYNTRTRDDVQRVLDLAARAGGRIEKPPQETFWGGYSGYFSDPDGHLWEVAWAEFWKFNPDGSLVVP